MSSELCSIPVRRGGGTPRSSHGTALPSSISPSVLRISVGLMLPLPSPYGRSRNATTSRPAITRAVTKPMVIDWITAPSRRSAWAHM